MGLETLLNAAHAPAGGRKPRRAGATRCRLELIQQIPPEHRRKALSILMDPLTQHNELKKFVIMHHDGSTKPFGCVCCPNATFQSMKKAERHLRGQFHIRLYGCEYWWGFSCVEGVGKLICISPKRMIDKDHQSKHKKSCPFKVW